MFLSADSKQINSPELLFNGACGSVDYFDVSTNGDEMSLIVDLGVVPLTSVTTHGAFNLRNVATPAAYSQFAEVANVVEGHTYAVLINRSDERGLFTFNVTRLVHNVEVDLQFEVKEYQLNRAPGAIFAGI